MSLSEELQAYISNVYATISTLSQSAKHPIIQFCSAHFGDPISRLCICWAFRAAGFTNGGTAVGNRISTRRYCGSSENTRRCAITQPVIGR